MCEIKIDDNIYNIVTGFLIMIGSLTRCREGKKMGMILVKREFLNGFLLFSVICS